MQEPSEVENARYRLPFVDHTGLAQYTKGGRARIPDASVPKHHPHSSSFNEKRHGALYIAHKDPSQNMATVVSGRHHPALYADCCAIPLLSTNENVLGAVCGNDDYFHFFSRHPQTFVRLRCKTGYNQPSLTRCSVTVVHDVAALYTLNSYYRDDLCSLMKKCTTCSWLHIQFARPVHAVSPHQILVFYAAAREHCAFDVCIGGGKIAVVGKSCMDTDSSFTHMGTIPQHLVCAST